jgi:hypothetical protein
MIKATITILSLLSVFFFSSCKKTSTLDFATSDAAKPAVPVTVSNLFAMTNGVPTVQTSLSGGGNITITLQIPSGSGRTIKQITKVALASNTTSYTVVQNSTAPYNTAPIPGNGTSVTFTTTLAEYTTKTGLPVTTGGAATTFLARYFYFLVTLDNGDQLIPVPVRVYVNS